MVLIKRIIPEVVIYTQLKLPSSIPSKTEDIEALRKNIALQVQGEAVEILENHLVPLLMISFDVIHRVSPEMVLRLNSGKRILLFDHWGADVFRDEDIYIINEAKILEKNNKSDKFCKELVINLEDIWNKEINNKKDELEATKKSLNKVKKLINPSITTTLIGKGPALIFLLTQHLLYGKTGEIWYQESLSSTPIKITTKL